MGAKVLAGHILHEAEPSLSAMVPVLHLAHIFAPAVLDSPFVQLPQEIPPAAGWNVPALQGEHELALGSLPYVPSAHLVHAGAAAAENSPAGQSAHNLRSAVDFDPAWQSAQAGKPRVAACLPGAQTVHVALPVWAAYFPGSQAVQVIEPSTEE